MKDKSTSLLSQIKFGNQVALNGGARKITEIYIKKIYYFTARWPQRGITVQEEFCYILKVKTSNPLLKNTSVSVDSSHESLTVCNTCKEVLQVHAHVYVLFAKVSLRA